MSYQHLNINERCCIFNFLNNGMTIRQIGKLLDRSPSTIAREIKRNKTNHKNKHGIYLPNIAQNLYNNRRMRCNRSRIDDEDVINYINEKISIYWSPEQISNRRTDQIKKLPSTSTIYRMIHRKQLNKIQMINLRRQGKFKRPAEKRGKFNDGGRTLKKRPKEIFKRDELGHWEGDTVESGRIDHKRKSKYCFVTLVERKSRMYIAILVPDRTSANVTPAIIKAMSAFPRDLVKTITFDRGKEFSGYEEIEKVLNCQTYFCDPYCAWQKGTNENTNGLLREYYPKGMNLSEVEINDLNTKLELMNNRPRKCLNFKTPKEVIGL